MYCSASFLVNATILLSPKELIPYTIPKLTALAFRLCRGVTSQKECGTPEKPSFCGYPGFPISLYQLFVPGHMSQNTQFNLGVVCVQEHIPVFGNKYLSKKPSQFCPHRNILQIGSVLLIRPVAVIVWLKVE